VSDARILPLRADCEATRAALAALVFDVLPSDEASRIGAHLEACAACRADAARERDLASLVPLALDAPPPPPEVLARVLSRIHRGRRFAWPRRAWVARAAVVAVLVGFFALTRHAVTLEWSLDSPDVAVINLFAAIDSPISSRYEYAAEPVLRFDRSVGRLMVNTRTDEWRLVVHGLPRPPRGGHYVLTGTFGDKEVSLGRIERWEEGVATLSGQSDFDLLAMKRLSLELVTPQTRVRLLDAVDGAW
jgi:hypothetical protein